MKKIIFSTLLLLFFGCTFAGQQTKHNLGIKPGRNVYLTVKYLDPAVGHDVDMQLLFTGYDTDRTGIRQSLAVDGISEWGWASYNPNPKTMASFWKFPAKYAPYQLDNVSLIVKTFNGKPLNLQCPSKSMNNVVHGVVLFSISPSKKTCTVSFYQP